MHSQKVLVFYLFHDRPALTAGRLAHLLLLNGGLHIIACYGGSPSLYEKTVADVVQLSQGLGVDIEPYVEFICTTVEEPWYNIDLLPADWFARAGHKYTFDLLFYVEYDVLLLETVAHMLSHFEAFDFAASVTDSIQTPDWDWLKRPSYQRFLQWRTSHFHIPASEPTLNAFAPIHFISRSALEQYTNLYVKNQLPPVFIEIRFPNVLYNLGFTTIQSIFGPSIRWRPQYSLNEICQEIHNWSSGELYVPMAFHPFYEAWPPGCVSCE